MPAPVDDKSSVYQQMEATLLRQMLAASGAFKPSEVAGGQMRADLFVEALADAVAKGGGIGIARMLQDSIEGTGAGDAARAGGAATPPDVMPPGARALSAQSYPALPSGTASPLVTSPLAGVGGTPPQVTSPFGKRSDPISGGADFHPGIDLRAAAGTPIRAVGQGVVRRAGPRGGYGNAVELDHGGGVTTLYAHASEVSVKPGESVAAGQEIARVGDSGRTTGPHLHFEMRVGDQRVNPSRYLGVTHRALNTYLRRAEDTGAGTSKSARGGDGS